MTSTEINPTDVLAQRRAEPPPPPAWMKKLGTPEGRAEVFAEWQDDAVWGEVPTGTAEDLWVWIGSRSKAAQRLADAWAMCPLLVASMWTEAAAALAKRNEKKQ